MTIMLRGISRHVALMLAITAFLFAASAVVGQEDEPEDVDISNLSEADLSAMEKLLKKEIADSDKALTSLKLDTQKLREDQAAIDHESALLTKARDSDAQLKTERDRELEITKASLQNKQASIARMSARADKIKDQVEGLEETLKVLEFEKEETEKRYNDPSIFDVLDSRSADWSPVNRNVYNRTRHHIMPAISEFSEIVSKYHRRVSRTSRVLELLASALVCGFLCLSAFSSYNLYRKVRGKMTINHILFLGDAYCGLFWTLILVCHVFLLEDPLQRIQQRSPEFFFAFQLASISAFTLFIMVRVMVLASQMSLHSLGEVLATIVIGQHYYVCIWLPTVLDGERFRGSFFFYLSYALLFWSLASARAEMMTGPKQFDVDDILNWRGLKASWAHVMGRFGGSNAGRYPSFSDVLDFRVPDRVMRATEVDGSVDVEDGRRAM